MNICLHVKENPTKIHPNKIQEFYRHGRGWHNSGSYYTKKSHSKKTKRIESLPNEPKSKKKHE